MPRLRTAVIAGVAGVALGAGLVTGLRLTGADPRPEAAPKPAARQPRATSTQAPAAQPQAPAAQNPGTGAQAAPAPKVKPLPANAPFDYQLGGAYQPAAGTTVVVRDRTATPVPGSYSICYVNAFQTQPGEAAFWTGKHPDLLLRDAAGKPIVDPDWPDEYILDTSTAAKRAAIAKIEYAWIDTCATRGFQAVDPDNLDTWTRWPDRLTRSGNLALARLLTDRAHARGLAIGQKNAAELGSLGRTSVGFDFAVAESCEVYDECGAYTKAYGARLLEIEYTDQPRSVYVAACKARGRSVSVIFRDPDLVAEGRAGYHLESC